jgi:hypothetical protein
VGPRGVDPGVGINTSLTLEVENISLLTEDRLLLQLAKRVCASPWSKRKGSMSFRILRSMGRNFCRLKEHRINQKKVNLNPRNLGFLLLDWKFGNFKLLTPFIFTLF